MKNDFTLAFNEIMDLRALSREVVLEAIEQALISAYKRDADVSSSTAIEAEIDAEGRPHIYVEKEVVEDVTNEQTEALLEDARERHGDEVQLGDVVMMPVTNTSADFGRIAAQTAKQVILQRIREAEREALYEEFIEREGDLITGTIQSVADKLVTLSLGRAEAIMPAREQARDERYRQHDKIRVYVVEVNKSSRGPQIIVSRAHKDMLRRLLEYEVPEIYNGQVEIKSIAREAGKRSKVAVAALQEGVDPVGACVGVRGMRIQNIIKELSDEKIDVIEWDPEPRKFIAKALSPARVTGVYLDDPIEQTRTATVIVSDDQLSLAIGKKGINARLAAKLTGWRIDIKSVTETAFENFESLDEPPLNKVHEDEDYAEELAQVAYIIEKKRNNRPIMPEEFTTLTRFVDITETFKAEHRRSRRQKRRDKMEAVRETVPPAAFEMSLDTLELADDIVHALRGINNVGDLMVRLLSEENKLEKMLKDYGAGDDAMEAIRYALDDLVIPELEKVEEAVPEEEAEEEVPDAVAETEPEAVQDAPVDVEAPVADEEAATPVEDDAASEAVVADQADDESDLEKEAEDRPVVYAAEGVSEMDDYENYDDIEEEDILTPEMWPEEDDAKRRERRRKKAQAEGEPEEDWDDSLLEEDRDKKSKKKGKRRKVHLVYDEELGEVVAKRRRKGNRSRDEFDEFDL